MVEKNIDPFQLHPYQYLNSLNSLYQNCNQSFAKSQPQFSKVKLSWKPFSIMKIPNCFEDTYKNWQNKERHYSSQSGALMEDHEKRIWKDHENIMKRYFQDRGNTGLKLKPKTMHVSFDKDKDKKGYRQQLPNSLVKRVLQSGNSLNQHQNQVKEKVLAKLRRIKSEGKTKSVWRGQTATKKTKKISNFQPVQTLKTIENYEFIQNDHKFLIKIKQEIGQLKMVDEKDYLVYNKSKDLANLYRKKIGHVDCSISEQNLKKTQKVFANMTNIVNNIV